MRGSAAVGLMGLWVRILPGRSDNQQQIARIVHNKEFTYCQITSTFTQERDFNLTI